MFDESKTSPFAYILGTVLSLAMISLIVWAQRAAKPAPDPAVLQQAQNHFNLWGGYLVWENDLAEFALRSENHGEYTHFFEVRRANGSFTLRSIPALTRPLIDHGTEALSPLGFTETAAMRASFYRANPDYKPAPRRSDTPVPPLPPRPPERFAPKPTRPPSPVGDTLPDDTTLLARLAAALAHAGEGTIDAQLGDLRAVLSFNPPEPLPTNPTAPQIEAAIKQEKFRIEGILAASSVFLHQRQLQLYRRELNQRLTALEARRPALPSAP